MTISKKKKKKTRRGNVTSYIRWAREEGCPWGADTCSEAADARHFEILKWAHAQGCPWNKNVLVSILPVTSISFHYHVLFIVIRCVPL
jgi:hypothetical protein